MSKIALGGWFLKCADCGVKASWTWTDNDEDYLRAQSAARRAVANGGPRSLLNPDDARMEKISYGAAIAFIPQAETFVDLPNAGDLQLSEAHRVEDLCEFIAGKVGWVAPNREPTEAVRELARGGVEAQAIATRIERNLAAEAKLRDVDAAIANQMREEAEKAVNEAYEKKLLTRLVALPGEIRDKITRRSLDWASRYDPFQLAIEHSALTKTKLSVIREGARHSFVRFVAPDEQLLPWQEGTEEAIASKKRVEQALAFLGMEEAGLIPKFELCRFTYGYSRTSSGPKHPKRNIPVRLKLFPKVQVGGQPDNVHPVYVMRQKNEAFYFRLDAERVRVWLDTLDCEDGHLMTNEPSLAAALLRSLHPMDRFLTEHDRDARRHPRLYAATYGLLHSMAHHVIRTMSRLSGLDEGGLGEYLFPLDLAFVVYRSGMTMDLGDLSSLWRNSWQVFLNELRAYPTSLGCNVGSLCAEQGAACPDCLMIPEVACVAGNRYLSRSLLTGEGHPAYMNTDGARIRGYLEFGPDALRGVP